MSDEQGGLRLLTAAARRFLRPVAGQKQTGQDPGGRQSRAWSYWDDDTPEVGFGATWIGNQMARARLFAGYREPDGSISPLPEDSRAAELVAQIAGGPSGQADFLAEFGPHLVVSGEGWIVVEFTDAGEVWHVLSTDEVRVKSGALEADIEDRRVVIPAADSEALDPNDTTPLAIRVWKPHPRKHSWADSPIMRSFALLDELRLLNAAVAAIAKSRLTGRGILFVAQGAKFPSASGDGAEDDLTEVLIDAASTAYSQPDSAAATVPIIVEVPQEAIEAFKHLTFESEFDTLAVELREETIRRFASALDTPAEVLLGQSDANHWGAWAIEESAIRVAIEPRLTIIANALTKQWLRPALEAEGDEDANRAVVWYDTTDLRVRSNRSQTALELYDRDEITGVALRRETGFDEADAPVDDERADSDLTAVERENRQLIIRILDQAPTLALELLPLLGIDPKLGPEGLKGLGDASANGNGTSHADRVRAQLPRDEDPGVPESGSDGEPEEPSEALLAACDGLVYRALERAGQRLRSRQPRCDRGDLQELEAAAVHTEVDVLNADVQELKLLADAWVRVPAVADRYGYDPEELAQLLDDHVRTLLITGVEYDPDELRLVLERGTGVVR